MKTYDDYKAYKQDIYKEMCVWRNKSEFDKAFDIVKKGYEFLEKQLGMKDELTLDLMHLTASRAKDAGKLEIAIEISKKCYELKKELYGELDIRTFRGRNHYIAFSGEKRGYEYAKNEFRKLYNDEMKLVKQYIDDIGLENTQKKYSELLELTVTTLFNYANRLSYVGDYWLALKWMKQCYEESKKYMSMNYIITTRAEHNIIDRWLNVRNRGEAIKQAIQCYIDRCNYIDTKTHKRLELKHLYSTKAVLLELLAYQIYHNEPFSNDLKADLDRTNIFPNGFAGTIDELIILLEEMISDFLANGEAKTYEELHFYCVLAVLYSYKKDNRYIQIMKDVLKTIEEKDYYSNTNVDIIKIYSTMASHVVHSYSLSYEGVNGIQLAEEILLKTNKYLGNSNHATLTIMYQIAALYAENGNMEEYFKRTSLFFSSLSKFISNCMDENNQRNVVQSIEFISISFEDYVKRLFSANINVKKSPDLIDPLIQYKNTLFDLELFKSGTNDLDFELNEELRYLRKREYINVLERTNLKNIQNVISINDTILDIYDLDNNEYGVLLITDEDFDLLIIKKADELKNHPLLKENVYIAPDGTGYDLDFYILDCKISFLSLVKSILKYKKNKDKIKKIDVYADPQFRLDEKVDENDKVFEDEHTRSIERLWNYEENAFNRNLGEIPFSYLEGINIKKIYGDDCNLYLKKQANVNNFQKSKRCDILHIASHAEFIAQDKYSDPLEKARIYFAGYENCRKRESLPNIYGKGFISAKDIIKMDFENTQIVVLSACESGLGETYSFQGIYGFRRAFELVSIQTLILTTSKINDVMAAYFMEDFYKCIHNQKPVYESFLHAQEKIRYANFEEIENWRIQKKEEIQDLEKMDPREKIIFEYGFTEDDFVEEEWKNYIFIGNRDL